MLYKRAILSGLCGASLLRGFSKGFSDFKAASIAASDAARNTPSSLKRSIPVRTLDQLLGENRVTIRLVAQAYRDGQLPVDEAIALMSLLVLAQPAVVLEIGTYCGDTTLAMAENLPSATIHTIDLPPDFDPHAEIASRKDDFHLIAKRKIGEAFHGTDSQRRIIQHFGDSGTWDFGLAQGATFFFIDGSHTYAYCKSDTEKCYELCGGRGVFFWHDCDDNHPGVLEFIAEWRALGRDIVRIDRTALCYWSSL